MASKNLELIIAAGRGDESKVDKLVRSYLDGRKNPGGLHPTLRGLLDVKTEMEGFTALHVAAITGQSGVVTNFLAAIRSSPSINLKDRVNATDFMGRTPLHYAAWKQRKDVMNDLLSYPEVDVNPKDKDGFTPVHLVLIGCKTKLKRMQACVPGSVIGPNGDVEVLRPLLTHPDVQLHTAVTQTNKTTSLVKSTELPDVPLPSPQNYIFEDFGKAIIPMDLIVPNELRRPDDLRMLETVWDLEDQAVQRNIVNEIENQLRLIVEDVPKGPAKELNAMHLAAFLGLPAVMRILTKSPEFLAYINGKNSHGQTPLHLASQQGHLEVVRFLDEQRTLSGAVEDDFGRTAVAIAFEKKSDKKNSRSIVSILMQRPDVKDYVRMQHADRSVYVDGTNAILVGAALIASITFAGWLQPPLGYQQYHTPDSPVFEQYAAIGGHTSVKIFWIANSLSFYFAIAAILAGAGAVVPRHDQFIKAEVIRVKGALSMISLAFAWAIVFVVGAFTAAGYASLPPVPRYELYMILTFVVGFFACYFTFGIARSSNPSQFSRHFRYIDPGYYVSKPLAFIGIYT